MLVAGPIGIEPEHESDLTGGLERLRENNHVGAIRQVTTKWRGERSVEPIIFDGNRFSVTEIGPIDNDPADAWTTAIAFHRPCEAVVAQLVLRIYGCLCSAEEARTANSAGSFDRPGDNGQLGEIVRASLIPRRFQRSRTGLLCPIAKLRREHAEGSRL